ncbi:MAG: DUF2764 domain-containing protein [Culturomica sp.]|jgi:hypothetical protein|nr:DUF2764 domain-containing protein [Culturomica sp.]
MSDYTAFIAGLPELVRDGKLALSVEDFREQAAVYVIGDDKKLLDMVFLNNDNAQVLRLLNKHNALQDVETVYSMDVLEAEIENPENNLPEYLNDFIVLFKDGYFDDKSLSPENGLNEMYYESMKSSNNKFLASYAEFFLNLKNLTVAINAKKYSANIETEVIGNNEFAEALRTNHSKDFGLSVEFAWTERVIALMEQTDLIEREKGIDMLVWDFIDENLMFKYFSIERVIGFALQLLIVERWSRMNTDSGRRIFMEMIEKFKNSLTFEKQFES